MSNTVDLTLRMVGRLWMPSIIAATERHVVKTYSTEAPDDPDQLIAGEDGDFSEVIDYQLIDNKTGKVVKEWDDEENELLWYDCMYGYEEEN